LDKLALICFQPGPQNCH